MKPPDEARRDLVRQWVLKAENLAPRTGIRASSPR